MADFRTPVLRVRVRHDGRIYTPDAAAQAGFVLLPTGEVGQVSQDTSDEAPRLTVLDRDEAVAMLSTLALDADGTEVFVGDVIEEVQYGRRYVVQHGHAVVSELGNVGFFGAPLGTLERRLLRISDNLAYFRVVGTMFDEGFDDVE